MRVSARVEKWLPKVHRRICRIGEKTSEKRLVKQTAEFSIARESARVALKRNKPCGVGCCLDPRFRDWRRTGRCRPQGEVVPRGTGVNPRRTCARSAIPSRRARSALPCRGRAFVCRLQSLFVFSTAHRVARVAGLGSRRLRATRASRPLRRSPTHAHVPARSLLIPRRSRRAGSRRARRRRPRCSPRALGRSARTPRRAGPGARGALRAARGARLAVSPRAPPPVADPRRTTTRRLGTATTEGRMTSLLFGPTKRTRLTTWRPSRRSWSANRSIRRSSRSRSTR